jgi:hypothetical protein
MTDKRLGDGATPFYLSKLGSWTLKREEAGLFSLEVAQEKLLCFQSYATESRHGANSYSIVCLRWRSIDD